MLPKCSFQEPLFCSSSPLVRALITLLFVWFVFELLGRVVLVLDIIFRAASRVTPSSVVRRSTGICLGNAFRATRDGRHHGCLIVP